MLFLIKASFLFRGQLFISASRLDAELLSLYFSKWTTRLTFLDRVYAPPLPEPCSLNLLSTSVVMPVYRDLSWHSII